jgi:hypothetical protein
MKFYIKTFNVEYKDNLSSLAKIVIQSLKMKLYYYAIDDILYILKPNEKEINKLLNILNSTVIFLYFSPAKEKPDFLFFLALFYLPFF